MPASTSVERFTAVMSTVVAVAILSAAVTAQQARPRRGDVLARLESDLRFQFDMAFGHDYSLHQAHVRGLERTLDAWRRSPQSEDDHRLLVIWFRDAIVASMPGRTSKMPRRPEFGVKRPQPLTALATTESDSPPTRTDSKPPGQATIATVPEPKAELPELPTVTPYDPVEVADDNTASLPAAEAATPSINAHEHSVTVPAHPPSSPAVVRPVDRVQLNLEELNARIRGYHLGLAEVEAEILAGGDLSGAKLEPLVAQLEQLAVQYQFVVLYYQSLTPRERRIVAPPRPMSETVRLVEQRLIDDDGDFLNDFDAQQGANRTLSERLRALNAAARDAR